MKQCKSKRIGSVYDMGLMFLAAGIIMLTCLPVIAVDQTRPVVDVAIQATFSEVVLSNTNLLVYGGVELVCVSGQRYLLSVGSTEVREGSGSEILRRMTVARSKARAELANMLASKIEVERFLVADENRDELTSYFRQHARLILSNVRPIGSWMSEDRSVYYEAIVVEVNLPPVSNRK